MLRIPKIIHQTWRDRNLPPLFQRLSQTWRDMLPGWEYHLWTDEENKEFVKTHYPDFLPKYDAYPKPVQRADAIRYLLLQTFGGLYVDLDFECLSPEFISLLEDTDFVAGKEPYSHARRYGRDYIVCNALMASVPGHPFLEHVCQKMMSHPRGWDVRNGIDIIDSTGPFLLTDAYKEYTDKERLRIVEPELLYPIELGEADSVIKRLPTRNQSARIGKACAMHYFVGTWHEVSRYAGPQIRVIQTFWTARNNPLQKDFGWLHPEHNLMAWTLSCLLLREKYDKVTLYTDSAGKQILIDELHLPYTEVHVVFDDFPCLPQHWALAKVKTYSLQTEAFLHVDGDVFLSHPFSEEVLQANLVAQNKEIGTAYYRKFVDQLLAYQGLWLPSPVEKRLHDISVPSYNMGLFGGKDLDFIQKYCNLVFDFFEKNDLYNPRGNYSKANCNVIFEQIFFAIVAEAEGKDVHNVLGKEIPDEGYTAGEFCNFRNYRRKPLLHVLGGHKKNRDICRRIEATLLLEYPEYAMHVMSLFPSCHPRLFSIRTSPVEKKGESNRFRKFLAFREAGETEWADLSGQELFEQERKNLSCAAFMAEPKGRQNQFVLSRNPYVKYFRIPSDWTKKTLTMFTKEFNLPISEGVKRHVIILPDIHSDGEQIVAVSDLGYNVLLLLSHRPMSLASLGRHLRRCFGVDLQKGHRKRWELIRKEITYLLLRGVIAAQKA